MEALVQQVLAQDQVAVVAQEVRPGELLVHFPGVEDKVAAMRA